MPNPPATPSHTFVFDNSYARDLEGFYTKLAAEAVSEPALVALNDDLARELKLDPGVLRSEPGAAIFGGNLVPEGAEPLAQVYAGHQFGGFSPQLGDGRALLLGEVIDRHGNRRDIQLKGSGRTPYSRGGDGRAAIGPVLREYLIGEAMHALGIPTTRALAAATTGELVYREVPLPGAVLTRVASSHVRIGTFQYFAARGEQEKVHSLADYVIERHYPELSEAENPYLGLLAAVAERQANLVAQWMSVGFIHGVMNTDNMTISGETIDYGPCAFMEAYDPRTAFSSIDTHGRYAYGNQPYIAQWNLARFAETLIHLLGDKQEDAVESATGVLNNFRDLYSQFWLGLMRKKLGLLTEQTTDESLTLEFLGILEKHEVDFTLAFRRLVSSGTEDKQNKQDQQQDGADLTVAGRGLTELMEEPDAANEWLNKWRDRLSAEEQPLAQLETAKRINPLYIPRNHKVEQALEAATTGGDFEPFHRLLDVVLQPYVFRSGLSEYSEPAPTELPPYVTFCGT